MENYRSYYRSFREQSAHYFNRAHEGVPDGAVEVAAAGRGEALAGDDSWRIPLSSDQIEEIEAAIRSAVATGRPTGELTRNDFPLPDLGHKIAAWREELAVGRGFLLITGLPVERWPEEHCELFFWCMVSTSDSPEAKTPAATCWGTFATPVQRRTTNSFACIKQRPRSPTTATLRT